MAESAMFWDGVSYEDDTVASAFHTLVGGHFIIPEYLNNLEVITSGSNGSVLVSTGAAVVGGSLYINDAPVTVNISAAVNNRLDRIVVRRDSGIQRSQVTIIMGNEAATPSIPGVSSNDLPLAYIYVPAGYNPAATPIATENIHDERVAKHIGATSYKYVPEDIMPNGEFMAWSGPFPEGWKSAAGGAVTINQGNPLDAQTRGWSAYMTAGVSGEGMVTTVPIPRISTTEKSYFTLKGIVESVVGNSRITVSGRTLGGAATTIVTKDYYPTSVKNFTIRIPIESTDAYDALDISFTSRHATPTVRLGQVMLVPGWIPGYFAPKHEWLMCDYDTKYADANWSATAKSTGDTTLTYAGNFGGYLSPYGRGLIMRMRLRDSGSAAGTPFIGLYQANTTSSYKTVSLCTGGITNDYWRECQTYVSVPPTDLTNICKVEVSATGASTADCSLFIIGMLT